MSVTNLKSLKTLSAYGNKSMTSLNCNNCALTGIDIKDCTTLQNLFCYGNKLTSLNFSGLTALKTIECNNNQLTSLNVQGLTALYRLICYNNQLTSLNVQGLTALTTLNCYENKLTSLNVSTNSNLEELKCYRNELTSLNVQGLAKLKDFSCAYNKLTSLSVQGCTALSSQFNITSNQIKGAEMTSLINSMRTVPSGVTANFYVINQDNTGEGNAITNEQIRLAKGKNWLLYKYHNSAWEELTANVRGDVNGDGTVDVDDMNIIINIMVHKASFTDWPAADIDGSGNVDVDDLNIVINVMVHKDNG